MELIHWTYILYLLTGIPSAVLLFLTAKKKESLIEAYYGGAVSAFLIGVILAFFEKGGINPNFTREWGDLIAITLVLCGLFVTIRNSKPAFARFPQSLTALPVVIILFYPLIADVQIVKDLLMQTFIGGAVVVGVLMVSINQYVFRDRLLVVIGYGIFTLSYLSYWFFSGINADVFITAGQVMLAVGMIITAIGFKGTLEKD